MRAVNLIPADEQRGAGGGAGRTGGAAYVLIATLVALVVMATAYTLAGRAADDKAVKAQNVEQQASVAEAHAQELQGYASFADLSKRRLATVRSIADSRFDWAHVMHELARVIPTDTWLTSLRATISPAVQVEGGQTVATRAADNGPAVEIVGCTTSQADVARMISDLRRIDGVRRVSLAASEKLEEVAKDQGSAAAEGDAASGHTDCRSGDSRFPQFQVVAFFDSKTQPAAAAAPSTATAPASADGSTPVSSTEGATK